MALLFLMANFIACPSGNRNSLPPQTPDTIILHIPYGSGLRTITRLLSASGVIRSPTLFRWRVKLFRKEKHLKAGEYAFQPMMRHGDVLYMLTSGQVLKHRITVAEGLTFMEIGALLDTTGIVNGRRFIDKARDTDLVRALNLPGETLEGFLFPSTYFVTRDQDPLLLIREMVRNYRQVFTPEIAQEAASLGLSELEVVTLASVIEKETGKAEERRRIASVFHNRLRKGMRLQTDPTVIYGIENFNGNLTRKHLETYTPYNTYLIRGLPPGPIANPGAESILAAIRPEQTNFLYFVSRNDGTHLFTATYRDHNRAVDQFQRRRRQGKR